MTNTVPRRTPRGRTVPPAAARNQVPLPARLELAALLLGTAVLYLWNLGASGWANAFYSAAAQAGSQDWTAWFFGSSDAANAITVDKPPAALWITGLSVRLFGLNSWSILVPQALMGVATVWLVYLAVRRAAASATGDQRLAHRGGLLAGAVMALTPVAVLMFRFNNPDALLVLLMTAAAYAVLRAIQDARVRWLLLAGVLLGLGFLTKQLQVLLVAPGLAAVELIPAENRPYIGGSQTNSILELTLGYNGLGRLNGEETGSVGGGNGWGTPGLLRLFNSEFGGQVAWLLPSVLILACAVLWIGRQAPRTDAVRADGTIRNGTIRNGAVPESAATHDGGSHRRGGPRRAAGLLTHHRGNGPCRRHRERRTVGARRSAGHSGRSWPEGTWKLHLGRRRRGFQQCGGLPTGQRTSGDGGRWLQRNGSCPHVGAVPATRGRRQDPLLHWREHDAGRNGLGRCRQDLGLGGGKLPGPDRGRRDSLRPVLTGSAGTCTRRQAGRRRRVTAGRK
jgi:hypothetical protein